MRDWATKIMRSRSCTGSRTVGQMKPALVCTDHLSAIYRLASDSQSDQPVSWLYKIPSPLSAGIRRQKNGLLSAPDNMRNQTPVSIQNRNSMFFILLLLNLGYYCIYQGLYFFIEWCLKETENIRHWRGKTLAKITMWSKSVRKQYTSTGMHELAFRIDRVDQSWRFKTDRKLDTNKINKNNNISTTSTIAIQQTPKQCELSSFVLVCRKLCKVIIGMYFFFLLFTPTMYPCPRSNRRGTAEQRRPCYQAPRIKKALTPERSPGPRLLVARYSSMLKYILLRPETRTTLRFNFRGPSMYFLPWVASRGSHDFHFHVLFFTPLLGCYIFSLGVY